MKTHRFTIQTLTAFGTPLVGDSLFGQLCWAIVHTKGESHLNNLLNGYDTNQPFMVVSDAMPHNYLPLPTLPSKYWKVGEEQDRKKLKKKQWIEIECTKQSIELWQQNAKAENEIMQKEIHSHLHNTLDRQNNTTGTGMFAPYSQDEIWYKPNTTLDLYIVFDENRISSEEINSLLENIGKYGFGRDASIGLGKFSVTNTESFEYHQNTENAYLTLANCSPANLNLNKEFSFYQITTRFGRHGDIKALSNNPFKKPILLAKTGAVFTPKQWENKTFLGNGLKNISYSQNDAVHQGYAPVLPLTIEFENK
ncbi:CRISPR-associated protein Csm4 [Bisgaardia hudsonensis]|uniref:CRISPR system Cms protein Csm4 n=1 Tax=Bisgaardia hudsonensis TaxID=109472 RepID=A0A4R2N143_9PAST|nr:CRISPR-associated protein Csm4 [Bisgaardia hudsonensis]QLB13187.1 CRISPR-associated protein Csm4 [Bisgaardia hudsonensis]TCP13238.1 CRISPR-associated protein Csm4 [Bisgaardia hudsonensis]